MDDEPGPARSPALPCHQPKVVATGQSCGRGEHASQADRRLRPLLRRAARMARPARVRMRSRNPWVRDRRRLFGWKVRLLTAGSPEYWLVKSTLSPSRPDGAQDSPTTDGRPSQGTHPGPGQRTRGCVGPARRHAAHTQCLLPDMPCGMAQRLLACVLLVGQMGVGALLRRASYAGPSAGFRCGTSYLRAQLWTTLWMLPVRRDATEPTARGGRSGVGRRGLHMTEGRRGEGSS